METILNNQLSNEGLFMNYQRPSQTQKEIQWLDLTCFILDTAIHNEEDMGFMLYKDLKEADFESAYFASGEDAWGAFEQLVGIDMDIIEEKFECVVAWEDNDNTCIAKIAGAEYAILRM